MSLLGVEQKKGRPDNLDGRMTVYARVDLDAAELTQSPHPIASMIHNGLLAAQGNFREQNSLRDFLRSEMGLSLEEGLEQLLGRLDGLESALDPEKLKEKMEEMQGMEDFIPTPAKIVPFHAEAEILAQEGDVFFAGGFRAAGNAVLAVNAFPILYQACYREQVTENVRGEVERLVGEIERRELPLDCVSGAGVDVEQRLVREYIPNMLYCRREPRGFEAAEKHFRTFMTGYHDPADVDAVVRVITLPTSLTKRHFRLLELYAKKIAAVQRREEAEAGRLGRSIEELERGGSESAKP